MACVITDKEDEIRTKNVNGKPVRIFITKATRKCSSRKDALTEEEPEEDEVKMDKEIIIMDSLEANRETVRIDDNLLDAFSAFNDQELKQVYFGYTNNFIGIWRDSVEKNAKSEFITDRF